MRLQISRFSFPGAMRIVCGFGNLQPIRRCLSSMFNSMGVQKVAICAGIISSVIFVGSLFRISCVVFTMPSLEAR